jgi:UDPglucose 6-dehydrogenase
MQITVIGTGFVGVVTAAVFAKFGNSVWGLDVDKEKIRLLKKGRIPFYEPNLEDLVVENLNAERLNFTTSYKEAIPQAEVIFICVGTPQAANGQADLQFVFSVAESIAPYIKDRTIIVLKSTVPPSTNTKIEKIIKKKTKKRFFTAAIPEFLREGSAVADSLNPERVVIGATNKFVIEKLSDLHKPLKGSKIFMSPQSAQLTKYASNAYLATRITFINEIANFCQKSGADIEEVILGLGADRRIGSHYWYPGPGYGGSCFPKDVKELSAFAKSVGEGEGLFEKIDDLNERRIPKLIKQFDKQIGGFSKKKVAVLGLSFKPNTDDMREAPSIKFIPALLNLGATITAFDPKTMKTARLWFADSISYAENAYQAAKGADVLLLLIEWDEFKQLNLKKIKHLMRGSTFIDTRNMYDENKVKIHGFKYIAVGR